MTWKVSLDLTSFVELLNSSCIFSCLHASMRYAMYNLRSEKQFFQHSCMHDCERLHSRKLVVVPTLGTSFVNSCKHFHSDILLSLSTKSLKRALLTSVPILLQAASEITCTS
jgi:hypothetical protein